MAYIVSTLSSDVKYTGWNPQAGGMNVENRHVLIKGGHGVAHRRSHGGLETPRGVITHVSDDELDFLKNDDVFKTHVDNGFIKILETPKEPKAESVAKDLEDADQSAPLTESDFEKGGRAKAAAGLKIKKSIQ